MSNSTLGLAPYILSGRQEPFQAFDPSPRAYNTIETCKRNWLLRLGVNFFLRRFAKAIQFSSMTPTVHLAVAAILNTHASPAESVTFVWKSCVVVSLSMAAIPLYCGKILAFTNG